MGIFRRHITATIFIVIYLFWWIFSTYQFYIISTIKNKGCGSGYVSVFLLLMNLFLGGIYSLSMFINAILNKEENRIDFWKFLLGVSIPLIFFVFYIIFLN